LEIGSIFEDEESEEGASVTDLEILVARLLMWNLNGLV
jgi:hypothetical protein